MQDVIEIRRFIAESPPNIFLHQCVFQARGSPGNNRLRCSNSAIETDADMDPLNAAKLGSIIVSAI